MEELKMEEQLDLDTIKKLELDILKYIDGVCRENNIEYFLFGGSLLGAVREKGMIPWDDDIDIGLTRQNYNKLIDVLISKKNQRYKLLNNSVEKSYFYPFSKLIDSQTEMNEIGLKKIDNYGVYVDIFAIDNLPDNNKEREKRYKAQKRAQRYIFYWGMKKIEEKNFIKKILKNIIKIYSNILGIRRILKKYDAICTKYDNTNSSYAISCWPIYKKNNEIQQMEDFLKTMDFEFDGIMVKILVNYDRFLTNLYGNYMTPPPPEKRVSPHNSQVFWKKQDKNV
jgi:lipopolysaccharide cholinephosphotransferase